MRAWEVAAAIGKEVLINGQRDLGIIGEVRPIIGRKCILIKQCKSGLIQVCYEKRFYSVPLYNVDSIKSPEQEVVARPAAPQKFAILTTDANGRICLTPQGQAIMQSMMDGS